MKTQNTKHKTKNVTFKVFTIAFLLLMLGFNKVNAQGPASCDQCVENNLECPVTVKITFYCNGTPVTNNGPVIIAGNTTQCFQHPFPGCGTCDMEVELVSVGPNPPTCPITPPINNKVSMNNPGPVNPIIPAPCNSMCLQNPNNPPTMKYSGGLFWIGN